MTSALAVAPGVTLWPLRFDASEQAALLDDVLARHRAARRSSIRPCRDGQKFSVRMTNFGPLGWVSDAEKGYRYEPVHPATARTLAADSRCASALWDETTGYTAPPEACLVNFYAANARMGLHQDKDEAAADAPVLSVSLGDSAYFRFGGEPKGRDPPAQAQIGGCADVRRPGAADVSRDRPHPARAPARSSPAAAGSTSPSGG